MVLRWENEDVPRGSVDVTALVENSQNVLRTLWSLRKRDADSSLVKSCIARGFQLSHRTLLFPVAPVLKWGFGRVHLCQVYTHFFSVLPALGTEKTESISQEITTFAFTLKRIVKKTQGFQGTAHL